MLSTSYLSVCLLPKSHGSWLEESCVLFVKFPRHYLLGHKHQLAHSHLVCFRGRLTLPDLGSDWLQSIHVLFWFFQHQCLVHRWAHNQVRASKAQGIGSGSWRETISSLSGERVLNILFYSHVVVWVCEACSYCSHLATKRECLELARNHRLR